MSTRQRLECDTCFGLLDDIGVPREQVDAIYAKPCHCGGQWIPIVDSVERRIRPWQKHILLDPATNCGVFLVCLDGNGRIFRTYDMPSGFDCLHFLQSSLHGLGVAEVTEIENGATRYTSRNKDGTVVFTHIAYKKRTTPQWQQEHRYHVESVKYGEQ